MTTGNIAICDMEILPSRNILPYFVDRRGFGGTMQAKVRA
jgi:hypothetical protein